LSSKMSYLTPAKSCKKFLHLPVSLDPSQVATYFLQCKLRLQARHHVSVLGCDQPFKLSSKINLGLPAYPMYCKDCNSFFIKGK
jgi:hypothetical protein